MMLNLVLRLCILCVVGARAEIILQDVTSAQEFCKGNQPMQCNFANAEQTVFLSRNFSGPEALEINSASRLEVNLPCNYYIKILSSRNITINGGEMDIHLQDLQGNNSKTDGIIYFPDSNIESNKECPRRVSVSTSEMVTSISGKFTCLEFDRVPIKEMRGHVSEHMNVKGESIDNFYGYVEQLKLDGVTVRNMFSNINHMQINGGKLLNMSGEVKYAKLEFVEIDNMINFTVAEHFELKDSVIEEISSYGLTVLKSKDSTHLKNNTHLLMDSEIQHIKENGIVLTGSHVLIQGTKINNLENKAIVVNGESLLDLRDVSITNPVPNCIQLNGKASLNMTNVTINQRLFTRVLVQNINTDYPIYPLSMFISTTAQPSVSKTIQPDIHTTIPPAIENRLKPSSSISKLNRFNLHGAAWYWLVGMLALGLVFGIAIGCSLHMGRFFQKKKTAENVSLRFSELLAADTEAPPRVSQIYDEIEPRRPTLRRQDSGMSSSSFGSYAGFLDGRRSRAMTNNTIVYENPKILENAEADVSSYMEMNKGNQNTYVKMGKVNKSYECSNGNVNQNQS